MKALSLRLRLMLAFGGFLVTMMAINGWFQLRESATPVPVQLLISGVVGLLIAGSSLNWCLAPLHRVAREVDALRMGERSRLSTDHPPELLPLTRDLNAFIELGDDRLRRYRKRLDDLAHSFKTPLAIQRTAVETETGDTELRRIVIAQVERMDQSVKYHLKRAATHGQLTTGRTVFVQAVAGKLLKAFRIQYAAKSLDITMDIDPALRFPGPEGDLLEILGNLGDNACKAARSRVRLSARGDGRNLVIEVEDDGPGIPAAQRDQLLQRGRRGEGYGEGSGIGLALVGDIASEGYAGRVEIDDSPLGGVCVRVVLMNIS